MQGARKPLGDPLRSRPEPLARPFSRAFLTVLAKRDVFTNPHVRGAISASAALADRRALVIRWRLGPFDLLLLGGWAAWGFGAGVSGARPSWNASARADLRMDAANRREARQGGGTRRFLSWKDSRAVGAPRVRRPARACIL